MSYANDIIKEIIKTKVFNETYLILKQIYLHLNEVYARGQNEKRK